MGSEGAVAPHLLLLPLPSQPLDHAAWLFRYRQSFTSALQRLKNPDRSSTLLVAVTGPFLRTNGNTGNEGEAAAGGGLGISWAAAQSILAGLYSSVAQICVQEDIASYTNAGHNAVDTRIVLVDDVVGTTRSIIDRSIVRTLSEFASAELRWDLIFYPKTDQGRGLLERFLSFTRGGESVIEQLRLVGLDVASNAVGQEKLGSRTQLSPVVLDDEQQKSTSTYATVSLGGTFDHLHPGHKLLLSAAALLLKVPAVPESCCRLIVGVTGDELLKNKKHPELVQSWQVRARGVLEFLEGLIEAPGCPKAPFSSEPTRMTASLRSGIVSVQCIEIQDPCGPTITMEDIDALVVSGETRSGGNFVNDRRAERGWKPLRIFEIDVLDSEGLKISSTDIRERIATDRSKAAL